MLLPVHIEAQSPLAFAERKPGRQFRKSLPYIPGGVIFGALASYLAQQRHFDEAVLRALRCHNAYPATRDDRWVHPLPLTAIQPKGGSARMRRDTLVQRVCWEQQQPAALIYTPSDRWGQPWEQSDPGFYTLAGPPDTHGRYARSQLRLREVQQRVLTRVAINRRRGVAEDQRLYSPLVINEITDGEPTRFVGSLGIPEHAQLIQDALPKLTHLGGRQSTGLGAVAIQSGAPMAESGDRIAVRVDALAARFHEQATLYAGLGGEAFPLDGRPIFTINLLSDAILSEYGVPTTEFSAEALREATGIEAELLRAFTGTTVVGGWNVLWQQPKATAVAITKGSLFVFQARAPLTPDHYARLAVMQQDGIGERRQEGYGQVRVCDMFHLLDDAGDDEEAA